ncbi:MAG TPA: hypothetical protein VEI02_11115 [Planctomycetota bacterium]|nr:hypothetical protein [Planctomycetota bacterium]
MSGSATTAGRGGERFHPAYLVGFVPMGAGLVFSHRKRPWTETPMAMAAATAGIWWSCAVAVFLDPRGRVDGTLTRNVRTLVRAGLLSLGTACISAAFVFQDVAETGRRPSVMHDLRAWAVIIALFAGNAASWIRVAPKVPPASDKYAFDPRTPKPGA